MESQRDSVEETLDRTVHQADSITETERRSVAKPKISTTINAGRRDEGKATSAFRESTIRENRRIIKETSASGSHSEVGERGNKSARESKEDAATVARQVTSADGTHGISSRRESWDGPKMKSAGPSRIGARRRQRPFCDMIGKRERRREELEKMEGDLRQRLDMLECSMPAVMAWNICRMTEGASACRIKRILEKHFKAASELPSRSTPSCHYDCRVREVEAERKLALRKVQEARTLWAEKLRALEERKRRLEKARRVQEEQKDTMERLNKEIEAMREAIEKAEAADESCRYGECGDKQCRQGFLLAQVSSVTSIESGDIECLEKLQQLAEEELIMKKDIAELERREDAYMRTLQRADELWSKVEDDVVSSTSALQEQLDTKTAANQQLADRVCELEDALEKCRARMAACRTELEKFLTIEKLEAAIGRDDDVAEVTDRAVAVRTKVTHRPIGRLDDIATVKDDEVLARVEAADEEVSAIISAIDAEAAAILLVDDKYVSVKPDLADLAVERQVDLVPVEEKESVVRAEDFDYEQQRLEEIKEYLAQLGSLEELYEDDGEPCPPDFVCNDVVDSPTGMTDEELIAMGVELTEVAEETREPVASEEERKREELTKITDEIDRRPRVETERKAVEETEERPITTLQVRRFDPEQDVVIKRDELLSWIDKIDTIRAKIARYPELQAVKREADILAEQIGAHVGIKPKEVVVDEVEIKLDEIKYVSDVPAELPKIDLIEKTQVKPVRPPDIMTETTDVVPEEEEEVELESKIPIPEEKPAETYVEKKEIPAELPTIVSIETPEVQKTVADDETMKPVNEEKLIAEKAEREQAEIILERAEIEVITEPEIKELPFVDFEEAPAEKDLREEIIDVEPSKAVPIELPQIQIEEDDAIKPADEELLIVEKIEQKEEEIIPEYIERIEAQMELEVEKPFTHFEDVPAETGLKEEITVEPMEPSKPIPIELKIRQIEEDDAIKIETKDLPKEEMIEREAEPRAEIIEMEEVPPVTTRKEIELDAEKTVPIVDVKEIEELTVDEVSPKVSLVEVEKVKLIELPIAAEVEETEPIKQLEVLEVEITKVRDEKIEEAPERITPSVVPRKEEEEKLPKKEELPAEVPTLPELATEVKKRQEAVPLEGKFHVFETFEVEEKILIVKAKPPEATEVPAVPIQPRPSVKPYFVLDRRTKFEERELLRVISEATKPPSTTTVSRSVTRHVTTSTASESAAEVEITARSGVVEAELITEMRLPVAGEGRAQIISEYFQPSELVAHTEIIAGDRPEIAGRKIPWRERLKDQSTVTSSSAGSQTDKTSRVSHDRVERERARLTTDELLRSIKIAAGLTRGSDAEREIRTINYGVRKPGDDETATKPACDCCMCGNAASTSSVRLERHVQPRLGTKTTTPLAATFKRAFVPLKTDHVIPYDRLCADCKAKIQDKVTRIDKYRIERIAAKISQDREIDVGSSLLSAGTWCRAAPRKRTVEKRDQSCLAKMPSKRKAEVAEQKRKKRDLSTLTEQTRKTDVEPLTPSCTCFQLEKPSAGPMRKGNCYCAD